MFRAIYWPFRPNFGTKYPIGGRFPQSGDEMTHIITQGIEIGQNIRFFGQYIGCFGQYIVHFIPISGRNTQSWDDSPNMGTKWPTVMFLLLTVHSSTRVMFSQITYLSCTHAPHPTTAIFSLQFVQLVLVAYRIIQFRLFWQYSLAHFGSGISEPQLYRQTEPE